MRLELDEYSKFADRIRCTVKTEDGQYTFWWESGAGIVPASGIDNQRTSLSYQQRLEAAKRAKIVHYMIYNLNQNL